MSCFISLLPDIANNFLSTSILPSIFSFRKLTFSFSRRFSSQLILSTITRLSLTYNLWVRIFARCLHSRLIPAERRTCFWLNGLMDGCLIVSYLYFIVGLRGVSVGIVEEELSKWWSAEHWFSNIVVCKCLIHMRYQFLARYPIVR